MRSPGVRVLLIYYSDYQWSHWTTISDDRWPDQIDLDPLVPGLSFGQLAPYRPHQPDSPLLGPRGLTNEAGYGLAQTVIHSRVQLTAIPGPR